MTLLGDGTRAVPLSMLQEDGIDRRALCPVCVIGRLHPYKISLPLGGYSSLDVGKGWLAICVGREANEGRGVTEEAGCGFTMPITAYRFVPHVGLVAEGQVGNR